MKITAQFLKENGFIELPRLERQPQQSFMRCIAHECIGDRFMVASEDLAIMLSPADESGTSWFCWICKSATQVRHPHSWIHVRMIRWTSEVKLLYEGLAGREFFSGGEWDHRKWPKSLWDEATVV